MEKQNMNKDPTAWTILIDFIKNSPTLQGAFMAMTIAALRIIYDGERRIIRIGLETLICGFLSLSASGLLDFIEWYFAFQRPIPQSVIVPLCSMIGFIGVTALREFVLKVLKNLRKLSSIRISFGNEDNRRGGDEL